MSSCAIAFVLWVALAGGEQDWLDDFLAGSRALEEGRLEEARASFERSAHALPTHAPSAYQLACALARNGDLEAALAQLERAIDVGYDDAAVIRWDRDLAPLHEDPRFEALLAELPDRSVEARPAFRSGWFSYESPLSWTPDSAQVSSPLAIWDVRSGSMLALLARPDDRHVDRSDCGSDGRFVFSSGVDDEDQPFVRVYDAATGDIVRDPPEVVRWADGRSVRSRDLLSVYRDAPRQHSDHARHASLAWTRTAGAAVRDPRGDRVVTWHLQGVARAEPIAVAPDGLRFWTASFGCVREIDTANGRTLREVALDGRRILALAVRPDGEEIAAVDWAGVLHVVDSKTGTATSIPIEVFHGRRATSPEFDPLGSAGWPIEMSYSSSGGHCVVWSATEGLEVFETQDWRLRERAGVLEDCIADLAWSSDGEQLAVCRFDGRVSVLDLGREPAGGVELQVTSPLTVAFEPKTTRLWIGSGKSGESRVDVRDLATGASVRTLDHGDLAVIFPLEIGAIAFLPGGEAAVVAADGLACDVVVAWRIRDGQRMWTLESPDNYDCALDLLLSANGARAVLWGGPVGLQVVDAKSGEARLIERLRPDALAFAQGEEVLIAASDHGTQWVDSETGTTRLARVELPESGWLLHTPSGFVDGTRAGLDAFHLSLPDRSYVLDGLAAAIVDPKKVAASAAGVAVAPVELRQPPTLAWTSPTPRTFVVDHEDVAAVKLELEATSEDGISVLEVVADGKRSFVDRLDTAKSPRTLTLELPTRITGTQDVRLRAIDANGLASRPLHLTLDVQ